VQQLEILLENGWIFGSGTSPNSNWKSSKNGPKNRLNFEEKRLKKDTFASLFYSEK